MKYITLLFLTVFFLFPIYAGAQSQSYDAQWKQVASAEKKGLSQTAWNLAKKIYARATEQKDTQQQIKALIYQLKYRDAIEEDGLMKNMLELDSMAATAKGVPRALLQNLAANFYLAYVNRNRYQLQRRSISAAEQKEGPATWSLPHFYFYIDSLFQQSLQAKDSLQQLAVTSYPVLIDSGKNGLALRPTLYDILAHDALEFYTTQASFLELPADHFVMSDPALFSPATKFSSLSFPPTDSVSPTLKALRLYQDLIGFHLQGDSADALIAVDLDRLQYVFHHGVIPGKDDLYKQALRHIISRFAIPAKYKATALLARWHYNKGMQYDAADNDPKNRWALKKALELCDKVPEDVRNAGSVQCEKIKDDILRTVLALHVEKVNVPGKPFRVLVSYKNQEELWFKVVKLDDDPEKVYNQDLTLEQLAEKEVMAAWHQEFPLPGDYQEHSAEMKVNALPVGRYALIAAANPDFQKEEKPIVFAGFHVSDLAYLTDNTGGVLVLNRQTGKPVKKAKVRMWKRVYYTSKRKYQLKDVGKYKTNANGYVKIDQKEGAFYMPEITTKDDHLFVAKGKYYPYSYNSSSEQEAPKTEGLLFTDRSIYRPGQTLHFKGILYQASDGDNTVLEDEDATVYLYDANYQIIDSLQLQSNAYGSFAGSFHLPGALLNGRMHIAIDSVNTRVYFQVEEYKRPTFDMTWDSVAMTYQLGDTVALSGSIMGYNNVPISAATVRYEVTRKRYLIPYIDGHHFRRSLIVYPVQEAVVSHGTVQSGSEGHFTLSFPAIADETVPEGKRIFNYEVTADITDINGESHQYSYTFPIGDQSLLLNLAMKRKIRSEQLDSVYLSSTDLSGRFTPTAVALSLYALKTPGRFVRARYWEEPDQFLMDKRKFLSYFPHDEYKNEAEVASWEVSHPVYVSTDTTKQNGRMAFHYENILPGWYLLKVTARDKYGHFVSDSQYIQVYKTKDNKLPFHQILWTNTNELSGQPGDKVSWQVGSSQKAYIFEETETPDHTGSLEDYRTNNRIKEQQLKIENTDRGGMIKHYATVRYNRIFTEDVKIAVPWKNKRLNITYETFRNKILPGEKESWTLKITGPGQEKVNAELLAAMYDVSLDYFIPHEWSGFNELYTPHFGKVRWEGEKTFSATSGRLLYQQKAKTYPEYKVIYPQLKDFGYHWDRRFGRLAGNALQDQALIGYASRQTKKESASVPEAAEPAAPAPKQGEAQAPVQIRKDFSETAFFYPQLHTDDSGRVAFTFTAPEALTRWKLMLFAHTKDLKFAYSEKETVTRKPLMIQLNAPRFVRQGDRLVLSAKVSNLSGETQSGTATLHFKNTLTGKTIAVVQSDKQVPFRVEPGQQTALSWTITVPKDFTDALTYVVKAVSTDHSDGAQDVLPVLTNKARITASLPLRFSGNGIHQLHWDALADRYEKGTDIQPGSLTIEYTGNPIWYAVQALPFLDEDTRESANALFRKVYANSLSRYIALKVPHFKAIMQQWLTADTNALKSPLQKNQELKNVLLKETPWVEDAQAEAAQKSKTAHWYEDDQEQLRLKSAIVALQKLQMSNGGFSWFKGMPDSRYITQDIITGLGHLRHLQAWPRIASHNLRQVVGKAVPYLDARMKEDYNKLAKNDSLESDIAPISIQYLYARSFFPEIALNDSVKKAYHYFYKKAGEQWAKQNTYTKAMLALTFHRKGNDAAAHAILSALKESMLSDKNNGLYWKQTRPRYYWYQAPISTQALCIEAFSALQAGRDTLNGLRTWLLSQKQTHFWETRKATADAVYALLMSGTNWADAQPQVNIRLGDTAIAFGGGNYGLQYEKVTIPGEAVRPEMTDLRITITGAADDQPSWGAAYLQYFANMNKVDEGKGSDLEIERQISLETHTSLGKRLTPVGPATSLEVGDKVQVRLIVKASRDMEFVHLKDVRASCMEPLQVLSGFNWNRGLGYYSTVSDAAVHFYFQHMPKGTYVFTYPVYITQEGHFTGGLSQIECLYAPEIRAHSEGIQLQVK